MANTTTEGSESDEEVNINNLETLQSAYHESSPTHLCLNIIKIWERTLKFKSLSKDYKQFQGKHEEKTNNSSKISTQPCGDFESLKLKTTKLHLENEEICKEKYSLLEDLQKLNNHLEGLQNEYATLSKLHDCLNEEMCNLLKEYSQVHKN